jgi:hypothetical protein
MATRHTIADLHAAEARLAALEERSIGSDRHSNPNAGRDELNSARLQVDLIRSELKAAGLLQKSERELLWEELDARFPNAESKQIVEHKGKRYQRRYSPGQMSRTGKSVMEWLKYWDEIPS